MAVVRNGARRSERRERERGGGGEKWKNKAPSNIQCFADLSCLFFFLHSFFFFSRFRITLAHIPTLESRPAYAQKLSHKAACSPRELSHQSLSLSPPSPDTNSSFLDARYFNGKVQSFYMKMYSSFQARSPPLSRREFSIREAARYSRVDFSSGRV